MKLNLGVVAAAGVSLLGAPTLAIAEPLLSFGNDVPLFLTASVAARRDDNVYLTPTNKLSDTIFILTPGTDLHFVGGSGSAGFSFAESFSRYVSNTALNNHLADLAGNANYAGPQVQFGGNVGYQEDDQTTLGALNAEQTIRHATTSAGVNLGWSVSEKTKLGAAVSYGHTTYPEAGFVNDTTWSVPVDLYYALTPKVDASMGYSYSTTTLATGVGGSHSSFFNVGARGAFTPKLSGQVRVGWSEDTLAGQPATVIAPATPAQKDGELGVGASLDYAFSPRTTFDLGVNNGFATSAVGSGQEQLSINAGMHVDLGPAWAATVSAGYSETKYLTVPIRKDHFWLGTIGLNYIITVDTNLQLSYLIRKNTSTLLPAQFDDNVATLTASTKF